MTLNPAFYRPAVISGKALIEFEKNENRPATKEEIEYAKDSDRIYREACIRSAKALKGIRALEKKEAEKQLKEKKKLGKKKKAEKKLKTKKIPVKKKVKSK